MSSGFAVTTYEGKTPAVGILSAQTQSIDELNNPSIVPPSTTLEINQERYAMFLEPCQNIDAQIVVRLNQITTDKTALVQNSSHPNWVANKQTFPSESAAQSAAETAFGDTLTESEGMTRLVMISPSTSGTVSAGAALTQVNGAAGVAQVSQSYTAGTPFELIVRDVSGNFGIGSVYSNVGVITDCSAVDFVGTGRIYSDNVILTFYPNLEPPTSGVDNPFNPENLPPLSSSNQGVGVANTFYRNSLTNPGIGPNSGLVYSTSSINDIGYVYLNAAGQTPTISALISNIGAERTALAEPNNAVIVIKGDKRGYAQNTHALVRTNNVLSNRQANLRTAVGILEDPQYGGPY